MVVVPNLSEPVLRQHLRPFRLGDLVAARSIPSGTPHTLYEIITTRGRFVMRILEDRLAADAHYEEALLQLLTRRGLKVPQMLPAGGGGHVLSIAPRQQLSVFHVLPGREIGVFEVKSEHCAQIGTFLAELHLAGKGLKLRRRNRFDPVGMRGLVSRCRGPGLTAAGAADLQRLADELALHPWSRDLPRGVIHADLFIDNCRFQRGRLRGTLNFELACNGPLLFDLAVAIVDWAFLGDVFEPVRAQALVQAYGAVRPLKAKERADLHGFCRYAAARFAIGRMLDFEVRRSPNSTRIYRDYRHFTARLQQLVRCDPREFAMAVLGSPIRRQQDR